MTVSDRQEPAGLVTRAENLTAAAPQGPTGTVWCGTTADIQPEWALAEELYNAFWARQPSPNCPPFADQADAIRVMWWGIGQDAAAYFCRESAR